ARVRLWRWRRGARTAAATATLLAGVLLLGPRSAQAQVQSAAAPGTQAATQIPATGELVRLSRDEAIKLAIENNADLAANRFNPAISGERVAAARSAFVPTLSTGLQRNSQ